MISLNNFSIGFGARHLLSDVNSSFSEGRLTALIGRNGTGKSTLLRAIAGLNHSYHGSIRYDNLDLKELPADRMAKILSFVSTERTRIPNLKCRDIVAIGRAPYTNWIGRLRDEDLAIVDHSLELVGMSDFADRAMDRMSDGECQRVMIARALAQATPVLLLDEPTSFLDMPNRYELCSLLRRLAHEEGKCIIFSTHELDIALRMCDNIALIDSPHLHCLPPAAMINSGHIQRLFRTASPDFDLNSLLP